MDGIAAGVHLARDHHHISNLELAYLLFVDRRNEVFLGPGQLEAFADGHSLHRLLFMPIQPALYFAGLCVEHYSESPKRPAVVRDRHKETGRKSIERSDLAADQCNSAAKTHRADVQRVCGIHYIIFELG